MHIQFSKRSCLWWLAIILLWLCSTIVDRYWLASDLGVPAWDQAEYLNSALTHGQKLGLLPGGDWTGFEGLLDHSPKIPPLSSLVSGTVMALVGDDADSASWVLSLWHGLLLMVVACWGRQLGGPGLGFISACLVAISPALAYLRVDFTLDMPLTASTTLALWLLGHWQSSEPNGGKWLQGIAAAIAIGVALLIKQSALLVIAPLAVWSASRSVGIRRRRWQVFICLGLVLCMLMPWLHHNWITTISGTHRAVVISAAEEGDPSGIGLNTLLWYPRLWFDQLGFVSMSVGLLGLLMNVYSKRNQLFRSSPLEALLLPSSGWEWLAACCVSGWFFISLSPNKDPRYIAPVLPLLAIVLASGWWYLIKDFPKIINRRLIQSFLGLTLFFASGLSIKDLMSKRTLIHASPVPDIIQYLRSRVGRKATTLLLTASSPDVNDQTLSYLGRQKSGELEARRIGIGFGDEETALAQGEWWLLATGDQGSWRESAKLLSRRVRQDSRYQFEKDWPWTNNRRLELWSRKKIAPSPKSFDRRFISLARGMGEGISGLETVFESIDLWHMLDPRFTYQKRVEDWASMQLDLYPEDQDALWSLGLLKILQNRPKRAEQIFAKIEELEGEGGWPTVYRSLVLLADWNTCKAARTADVSNHLKSSDLQLALLNAFRDLARSTCFDPRGFVSLSKSLSNVSEEINRELEAQ